MKLLRDYTQQRGNARQNGLRLMQWRNCVVRLGLDKPIESGKKIGLLIDSWGCRNGWCVSMKGKLMKKMGLDICSNLSRNCCLRGLLGRE